MEEEIERCGFDVYELYGNDFNLLLRSPGFIQYHSQHHLTQFINTLWVTNIVTLCHKIHRSMSCAICVSCTKLPAPSLAPAVRPTLSMPGSRRLLGFTVALMITG